MPKQKRDYSAIKLEFFQSDFDEVKSFITHKWIRYNAEWSRRTKGRAKEKAEYKNEILQKALEKQANKESNDLVLPTAFLMKAKKNALIQIAKKLSKEWLSISDLSKGLDKIKVELWEPTTVVKSENENTNTEKIESINIVREKPKNIDK